MTPDAVVTDPQTPKRMPAQQDPPLKVLVVATTLVPGERFPAPVEFANELVALGANVMFAAAVGTRRTGLSRAVTYLLIDDAGEAPVKAAHELSRLIRHHQPDVVHSHGVRCAVVTALAVRACRAKCARVMTFYSSASRRLPRWIKGPVLRQCADRYFAADESLAKELEALGVVAEHIRVQSIDDLHAPRSAAASMAVYRELTGREANAA